MLAKQVRAAPRVDVEPVWALPGVQAGTWSVGMCSEGSAWGTGVKQLAMVSALLSEMG